MSQPQAKLPEKRRKRKSPKAQSAIMRQNKPGRAAQVLACLLVLVFLLTSCSNNSFTYTLNTTQVSTVPQASAEESSAEVAEESQTASEASPGPSRPEEANDSAAPEEAEPEDSNQATSKPSINPAYASRDWVLKPAKLEEKFRKLEADLGIEDEDIGYVFLDLESEEYWGKNLDRPFLAASVIKLPAALITYEWTAAGKIDLSLPITIEEEDLELGTGPISAAGAGLTYTVEELLQAAIVHSDNTAFLAIDRMWRQMGWLVTNMDIRYGLHYGVQRELTPRECLNFLWEFYDNPQQIPGYVTLEDYMKNTSYPAMAASYIPVPVARKYGKNGGFYHDVGIVYGDRPFAFAIFTKNLAYPAEAIGQLNLAFYEYSLELGD